MKAVTLQKHDTCFTYVLKRKGLSVPFYSSSDDYLLTSEVNQLHDPKKLKIGDILYYKLRKDEREVYELATKISYEGKITWQDVTYDKHFMIYEGNGMISEAVQEPCGHFSIQLRNMDHLEGKRVFKVQ